MEGAKLSIFESGNYYETLIVLDCNSYTLLGTEMNCSGPLVKD